jgi:hypothetical protein
MTDATAVLFFDYSSNEKQSCRRGTTKNDLETTAGCWAA